MIILGAGPRGLAVALYALSQNIKVTLIDPQPFSQWNARNIVPNIQLRSPITFDLVTYLPNLTNYNLSTFLNKFTFNANLSQEEIESNSIRPTRKQFYNYLYSIFQELLKDSNFTFIKDKVVYVEGFKVILASGTILRDTSIVCAVGSNTNFKIPDIITHTQYSNKCISIPELISSSVKNKKLLILGGGQGAAELVDFSCRKNNFVYWSVKQDFKIDLYPVPSYALWKEKSALGDYFKSLTKISDKKNYLFQVKQWQPSITPYIYSRLNKNSSQFKLLSINSYKDIPYDVDYIISATGYDNNFNCISSIILDVIEDYNFPNFPSIKPGFKLNDYVSITGFWAIPYDGPRQGSIISAGITAKEIVDYI